MKEKIAKSLFALLERENEDAFVIFEEKKTKKFVQFAGGANQTLLLDLPSQTLDDEELEKAKSLFAEFDVRFEVFGGDGGLAGETVETQSGFQLEMGHDVKNATELTLRIFDEVYRLSPGYLLQIEEN